MKIRREILLLQHLKKAGSIVFERVLFNVRNLHAERFFAEGHLYYIAYLNVVGSLCVPAVHADVRRIAGVVCNRAALYNTRYLQVFIQSHFYLSNLKTEPTKRRLCFIIT